MMTTLISTQYALETTQANIKPHYIIIALIIHVKVPLVTVKKLSFNSGLTMRVSMLPVLLLRARDTLN